MLVLPTLGAPSTTILRQFLRLVRPSSSRSTDLLGSRSVETCLLPELEDLLGETALLSCCFKRPFTVLMMSMLVFDMLETLGCCGTGLRAALRGAWCVMSDSWCPVRELNSSRMPSTGRYIFSVAFTSMFVQASPDTETRLSQSYQPSCFPVCVRRYGAERPLLYTSTLQRSVCVTVSTKEHTPFIEAPRSNTHITQYLHCTLLQFYWSGNIEKSCLPNVFTNDI